MNLFFFLFFIIKSISSKNLIQTYFQDLQSSTDIITVFPYEKIKVTQKDNSPLYFCFSTNSLFEENNTFVFDFYKGFSDNSKIYIYLNYNNFLNDKQNGNFNKSNYVGTISKKQILYDALQLGFTVKKIDQIYFAIQNKNEKNRQYIFNIYDYSNVIDIKNSFYNDFYYQYSLFYQKKIYISLKSESPIYFIYQFHSNKTISLGNSFQLSFYKNSFTNRVKNILISYDNSFEINDYFYLEDDSNYFLTIETIFSNFYYYDHFNFNGYYSTVPYFIYSLDNNESNFNYSFITKNNVYYYKNITSNNSNEIFEFELLLYDTDNNQLSSKPVGLYIYYQNVEQLDVYVMPKINNYVTLNKKNGHLMFSIKKNKVNENFIIIELTNSNYLQDIKGNIKYIIPIESDILKNVIIIIIFIIILEIFCFVKKKISRVRMKKKNKKKVKKKTKIKHFKKYKNFQC